MLFPLNWSLGVRREGWDEGVVEGWRVALGYLWEVEKGAFSWNGEERGMALHLLILAYPRKFSLTGTLVPAVIVTDPRG